MNQLCKSNFTTNIIALNQWQDCRFKTWLLKPGMGFAEPDKWWRDQGARPTLHEGLDLTGFQDNANDEYHLTEGTMVPPLYGGRLVNIIDDFLGRTVIVDHGLSNHAGHSLHGFYAHLSPAAKLKNGTVLNEAAGLGTIAAGNKICPAHLHISTVWISPDFPVDRLGWPDFAEQEGFKPCDPWPFI
ncbi:MAG: hypothetical protein KAS94_01500 [Desulfobulbaceae bacterium]|nr:hypothetical protein [Desulfobulbaceae bacterium]